MGLPPIVVADRSPRNPGRLARRPIRNKIVAPAMPGPNSRRHQNNSKSNPARLSGAWAAAVAARRQKLRMKNRCLKTTPMLMRWRGWWFPRHYIECDVLCNPRVSSSSIAGVIKLNLKVGEPKSGRSAAFKPQRPAPTARQEYSPGRSAAQPWVCDWNEVKPCRGGITALALKITPTHCVHRRDEVN
jgi:hypothetical protein